MTHADLESWREWRRLRREKFAADRPQLVPAAPVAEPIAVAIEAPAQPVNRRQVRAESLLERQAEWIPFTSKDGRTRGYAIPSSRPGKYYRVTLDDCDCADSRRNTLTCKHRRALQLYLAHSGRTQEFVPTPAAPLDWARLTDNSRFPRTTRED